MSEEQQTFRMKLRRPGVVYTAATIIAGSPWIAILARGDISDNPTIIRIRSENAEIRAALAAKADSDEKLRIRMETDLRTLLIKVDDVMKATARIEGKLDK